VIKITVTSVFVNDQDKALQFYTEVLGFVKKRDIPLGDARWLSVASPAGPEGIELLLEPNSNPIAKTYQRGTFEAGLPATTFAVDDLVKEYERLRELNVMFTVAPTEAFGSTMAIFDDRCGNFIQLHQVVTSD
jgi:catechol 2,3-dioxygenase-like lactoylglutathione lyase family enzyme